jgi:uncharacterized protein (DUF58 family)
VRAQLRGLTTRGRSLLAAGLAAIACAVVLDERDLARLGIFVLMLPLGALVVNAIFPTSLRARRTTAVGATTQNWELSVGQVAEVALTVTNAGRLGHTNLLVTDSMPTPLGASPTFLIGNLRPGKTARLTYSVHPAQRGRFFFGAVHVTSIDPLGMAESRQSTGQSAEVVVLPTVTPLSGLPSAFAAAAEESSGRTAPGAGEPDASLRPYNVGDELRRVNWKATARRDELMVRTQIEPRKTAITIFLDHRLSSYGANVAALEWNIAATASITAHFLALGVPTQVVLADGTRLVPVASPSLRDVLRALALLQPSLARTITIDAQHVSRQHLVVLGGQLSAEDVSVVSATRSGNLAATAFMPSMTELPAPWLTINSTAKSVPDAWQKLCRRQGVAS